MKPNEIVLSIDNFVDYFKEYSVPHIEKDFILFDNIRNLDSFDKRFIIKKGLMIGFLNKGKIDVQINCENYSIPAPAIITIFPDGIYEKYKESPDAEISSLFISFEVINNYYFLPKLEFFWQMILYPVLQIPWEKMFYIQSFKKYLKELYQFKETPLHDRIVRILLFALIIETMNNYPSEEISNSPSKKEQQKYIVCRFFALLRDTHPVERRVTYYANALNITPHYLSYNIKKITMVPVNKWINNAVLLEAKKMLKLSDLSIQEIAENLKFLSTSYFISFFRKETGMTPLSYRNNIP